MMVLSDIHFYAEALTSFEEENKVNPLYKTFSRRFGRFNCLANSRMTESPTQVLHIFCAFLVNPFFLLFYYIHSLVVAWCFL